MSAIQYSYIYYYAVDHNGNNVAERNETLWTSATLGYVGFDPADPTAATSVNRVDPDIKSPRAHELMFGLDRELMPNFSLSGTFTWRRIQRPAVAAVAQSDRRDGLGLHADRNAHRQRRSDRKLQRAVLRAERRRRAARRRHG